MRELRPGPTLDPRMGRRVEKASSHSLRERAPPAKRVGCGCALRAALPLAFGASTRPWWMTLRMCPWTLAMKRNWPFGKPRSGMLGLAFGRHPPKLPIHPCTFTHSFIQNVFSAWCVPGMGTSGQVLALLEPVVGVGGD